jgi:hypothetical protein
VSEFVSMDPTDDAYWRAIILFGQNSMSYKFALGKALLELAGRGQTFVSLEDLAVPYANHIIEHLKVASKQGTSRSSRFLDACKGYNSGQITHEELVGMTTKLGFANVIDAFHVVNRGEIPTRFFQDDRKARKGITLTDELLALKDMFQYNNLIHEVEARWRLVESAWSLNISPRHLSVEHDWDDEVLFIVSSGNERNNLTSSRDALNGYQKGRCFYCYSEISVESGEEKLADVDHFFPHTLNHFIEEKKANLDGVWNLVLACQDCNRGVAGKFANIPQIRLLERLHRRNNYLIESHHPLRETLMLQTGSGAEQRRRFLEGMDAFALEHLIHRWEPSDEHRAVF